MENFYLMIGAILAIAIGATIIKAFISRPEIKHAPNYRYEKRTYLLTKSEKDLYDSLKNSVGNECQIFPQVHLSSILNHEVPGQSWKGALAHIQRKSVDFLICDNHYLSPKLAIELDDPSHGRPDRVERDHVVDGMLKEAGIPILRLKYNEEWSMEQVVETIKSALK